MYYSLMAEVVLQLVILFAYHKFYNTKKVIQTSKEVPHKNKAVQIDKEHYQNLLTRIDSYDGWIKEEN